MTTEPRSAGQRNTPVLARHRFQQTMKNWLRAQPRQPDTPAELQPLLNSFTGICSTRRPHRSLPGRATGGRACLDLLRKRVIHHPA
jgi:hypothetical protein